MPSSQPYKDDGREDSCSGTVIFRWLLGLTVLGIIYGSLYPFAISSRSVTLSGALNALVVNWDSELGWPNLFANIVLFVPYGLFGVLSISPRMRAGHWIGLFASAAFIAIALQVAQLWLSARNPTLVDALINMGGLILGAGVALIPGTRNLLGRWQTPAGEHRASLPVLLMLAWLGYQWFPFVPTVDVQAVKDGLKPLLLDPQLRPLNLLHNLTAWLVFAVLWHQSRLRTEWLWLFIPAVVLAKTVIASNNIHLHNVLAAILAPVIWAAIHRLVNHPYRTILVLLVLMLFMQGLRPFEMSPSGFKWIPFTGFLTGNMAINTLSLFEKLFLYGGLVWLTLTVTGRRSIALALPVVVTLAIEIMQTQVAGRVAEITDPLLCLMIWILAIKTSDPIAGNPRHYPFVSER